MSVVFAVCPWIVYAIVSSFTSVAVAALAHLTRKVRADAAPA
ncbi:hypothetical protein [Nocardia carnea]|nr:hypothetical protein [Nocardia carnea]